MVVGLFYCIFTDYKPQTIDFYLNGLILVVEQTVSMKYNCQQALYYSYVMYVMKYYENTLIKCKVYVAK